MAFSTTLGFADCDSGGSGCGNYASIVQDVLITRAALSVTKEVRSDPGDTNKGKPETSSDQAIIGCHTVTNEGGKFAGMLPEDVMEKIIARLPFRSLFQARLLARRWASIILSSGAFETFFQSEIMANSLSYKWDSYCPMYVGMTGLIGYNLVSKCWQRLLSLSYLPISEKDFCSCKLGNIAGALLSLYSAGQHDVDKLNVWVTNPLNQSWSLLHPFNLTRGSKIVLVHLKCVGAYAYKLIVITADHILVEGPDSEVFLGAQVYDSVHRCWTRYHPCTKRIDWMNVVSKWYCAHVKDTLYMMGQNSFCGPLVVTYNMKDEIWSHITIYSPQPNRRFWSEAVLFPCGSKMMIISIRQDGGRIVTIYELNHESQTTGPGSQGDLLQDSSNSFLGCSHLTTLQLPLLFTGPLMKIASDAGALYFSVLIDESATCEELDVKVFNVHEQVWHSLLNSGTLPIHLPLSKSHKWASSAFQPGLNPFVNA